MKLAKSAQEHGPKQLGEVTVKVSVQVMGLLSVLLLLRVLEKQQSVM